MSTQYTRIISALGTVLVVAALTTTGMQGTTDTRDGVDRSHQEQSNLTDLARQLQGTDGFLGLQMAPANQNTVQALFTGSAPDDLPDVIEGYTLEILEDLELQRGRVPIEQVVELSEAAMLPTPASATGIGPGAHLIISIPGEGTFGCTANFVWEEGSTLYLGAAGHCFLPEDEVATHGESPASANYDASGVVTKVCVSSCSFGGQSGFIFTGVLKTLGDVAYARQTGLSGDLGNDFGIVEIPSNYHTPYVRTQMPVWGGPHSEGSINGLAVTLHYGAGVGYGETYLTQARAGMSLLNTGSDAFLMEAAASPGDSGSAVNTAALSTSNVFVGDKAGGILTHLVASVEVVGGTQVPKAKDMASDDAGISISVKT